jgi:hypothetical protein
LDWNLRARLTPASKSFHNAETIFFGIGSAEFVLEESTEALFRELVQGILEQRQPDGSPTNLFFRLAPERWLETLITREVRLIDERLDGRFVYSQVPAFAASDRAMLDVLTCTLDGRLAILELKANEDIHLPPAAAVPSCPGVAGASRQRRSAALSFTAYRVDASAGGRALAQWRASGEQETRQGKPVPAIACHHGASPAGLDQVGRRFRERDYLSRLAGPVWLAREFGVFAGRQE